MTAQRKPTRLTQYDYRSPGAYFVTICTHERRCTLGEARGDSVHLSPLGELVERCWTAIPRHFPQASLDVHVVMPNHLHGIVVLADHPPPGTGHLVGARHAVPLQDVGDLPGREAFGRPVAGSLPTIIRSFKSAVSREFARDRDEPKPEPVWQRGFYENVIRNEEVLARVREYIVLNPAQWALDALNASRP